MNDVNPELTTVDTTPRAKIAELFGSSPTVVLKAVGNFLTKMPGTLDHHNLRTIAAAAPHIRDPKLVAQLIDEIPLTGMHVAARPIDVDGVRAHLARILPSYPARTRQRLVADLVYQTTLQFVSFVPPDEATERARSFMEQHLVKLATKPDRQAEAIASPFATARVVDAALDHIEQRIDRAARRSVGHRQRKLPLQLVAGDLAQVFDSKVTCTTPAHVARAWQLVERCARDRTTMRNLIRNIVINKKLESDVGHSVLDMIGDSEEPSGYFKPRSFASRMRGYMVAVPEMPEDVVQRAVAEGATLSEPGEDEFESTLDLGSLVDARLFAIRKSHYASNSGLLNRLSSRELDRRAAALPPNQLTPRLVRQLEDSQALRVVAAKARSLSPTSLTALIENQHLPADSPVASSWYNATLGNFRDLVRGTNDESRRRRQVIVDPRLTDAELVGIVKSAPTKRLRTARLEVAVRNPSAGQQLFDYAISLTPHSDALVMLAESTASPQMHRRLAELVTQIQSSDLVEFGKSDEQQQGWFFIGQRIQMALRDNGSTSMYLSGESEAYECLLRKTPEGRFTIYADDVTRVPLTSSPPPYPPDGYVVSGFSELDVAAAVIRDGSRANHRIDALVAHVADQRADGDLRKAEEAVALLAEADLLSHEHWLALSGALDRHVALRFAMHRNCKTGDSLLAPAAETMISNTVEALDAGVALPSRTALKSWDQLPDVKHAPFPRPREVELLDGRLVAGRRLKVISTPRELTEVADWMGNCLDGYQDDARQGRSVIATAGEKPDLLAVSWVVDKTDGGVTLRVGEINSRFNRHEVPRAFATEIRSMTAQLTRRELQVEEDTTRSGVETPRRAPVRRRALDLATHAAAREARPRVERVENAPTPLLLTSAETETAAVDERGDDLSSSLPSVDATDVEQVRHVDDSRQLGI